jgi:hypothetical protein
VVNKQGKRNSEQEASDLIFLTGAFLLPFSFALLNLFKYYIYWCYRSIDRSTLCFLLIFFCLLLPLQMYRTVKSTDCRPAASSGNSSSLSLIFSLITSPISATPFEILKIPPLSCYHNKNSAHSYMY